MFGTEPLFGLDPLSRPVAIAEILLLLSFATIIGWLLGRLIMSGRVSTLRSALVNKEAELDECRRVKRTHPATSGNARIIETSDVIRPVSMAPMAVPPAFVHADPIEPATSFDTTPEIIIDTDPLPLPDVGGVVPPRVTYTPEAISSIPSDADEPMTGNSEAAVLNRIAARADELNFDRIGRATAAEADDLKDIVGIGPFLERKLHILGIYTFRQVSNFTKEDIDKVNDIIEFFPGRIERDNWVDQSRTFHERKYGQ